MRISTGWARGLGLVPLLAVRCDCSTFGLGAPAGASSTSDGAVTASMTLSTDTWGLTGESGGVTVTSEATQGEDGCEVPPACARWGRALLDLEGEHTAEAHVVFDAAGNVVLAGSFAGSVDFGGKEVASKSEMDIFVARYNPGGELMWVKTFATADLAGYTYNNDVAVSPDGRIHIVGTTSYDIDLGGGLLNVAMAGSEDMFVAQYSEDGASLWSKTLGQTGREGALHVALDSQQSVVIAGYFSGGPLDLGGVAMTARGKYDLFVLKLDGDGSYIWSGGFGGPDTDMVRNMIVDGDDEVVVLGDFAGTLEAAGEVILNNGGWNDPFVLKLDAAGGLVWSMALGSGANTGYVTGLAAGPRGSIVLGGWFEGSLDIGGSPLTTEYFSPFMTRLDPDGGHVWSRVFPVLEEQAVHATSVGLGVGENGVIWFAAMPTPPIDMLGGRLEARGEKDVVLATYDADGNHRWSGRFGDWAAQDIDGVSVDAAGDVVVTGTFLGALEFVEGDVLQSAGLGPDIFVARMGDCPACE